MPWGSAVRVVFAALALCRLCDAAEPGQGVLSLPGGDAVAGEFRPSDSPDTVRWQGTAFTEPFEFPAGAVASVRFPPAQPPVKAQGEFAFELATEDVLTGRLVRWGGQTVEIETPHFGVVKIQREAIRRMSRLDGNPAMVFAGLAGLGDWRVDSVHVAAVGGGGAALAGAAGGAVGVVVLDDGRVVQAPRNANAKPGAPVAPWKEDGAHLWTDQPMTMITGDLGVPEKAVIEFELAWSKSPNFVFAVAADPSLKTDKRQDGWRFEAWDGTLVLVREQPLVADVDKVQDLGQDSGRVQLTAYLDQTTGRMDVFLPDGTPAGKVSVPPSRPAPAETGTGALSFTGDGKVAAPAAKSESNVLPKQGRGIRLLNRRGEIRLERLRIARWNGVLPSAKGEGESQLQLADGKAVNGKLLRFEGAAGEQSVVLATAEGEATVPLTRVISADFPAPVAGPARASVIVLQDGTRVSGNIASIGAESLSLRSPEIDEPVTVPFARMRTLTRDRSSPLQPGGDAPEPPLGRGGRLELGGLTLTGRLVPAVEKPGASGLAWHPDGSRTGSPLKPDAAGRIVYRNPLTPQQEKEQRARGAALLRGLGGGNRRVAAAQKVRTSTPTLHLRSGDNIPCTVTSIDETGVTIATPLSDSRVVPHGLIKAAELISGSAMPSLREAKKQRLLTLPRLQKASPPTHLLISKTGDFLRCRIMTMTEESLRVEVQLSEMEIPRTRIAHVVWFHPDELADEDAAAESTKTGNDGDAPALAELPAPAGARLAQVLGRDGRRVTFAPREVDDLFVSGTSEVLGPCRFKIGEIDQLIFGGQIEAAAAQLAWHQWRLHPAIEPLVAQDLGNDPGVAGPESPLIGQPAPEIELELLDGTPFRLSACKGQIVLLDFWASWCGPCMRTMPLVEEAMREFDPKRVRLVAVNLEETADQIRGALERQKLNVTVALDIDGVAARRYEANAIPQLVIVDPEGKVAHLYVGGGEQVVERLKADVGELLKGAEPEAK